LVWSDMFRQVTLSQLANCQDRDRGRILGQVSTKIINK